MKKYLGLSLLAGGLAFVGAQAAFAGELVTPRYVYITAAGVVGAYEVDNIKGQSASNPDLALSKDYGKNTKGGGFFGVGFAFPTMPIRLDLTYAYRSGLQYNNTNVFTAVTTPSTANNITSDISSQNAMLSAYYDIELSKRIVPYLMVGAGFAKNKVSMNAQDSSSTSKTTSSFAWQFGAGAMIKVLDNFYINLGYERVSLGKVKWGTWGQGGYSLNSENLFTNEGMIGVLVFFGYQGKVATPPSLINDEDE